MVSIIYKNIPVFLHSIAAPRAVATHYLAEASQFVLFAEYYYVDRIKKDNVVVP
jgi:hypothetical protein